MILKIISAWLKFWLQIQHKLGWVQTEYSINVQHQCTVSRPSQPWQQYVLLCLLQVLSSNSALLQANYAMWRFDIDAIDITSWHCSSADCHAAPQCKQSSKCVHLVPHTSEKRGLGGSPHPWAPHHCQPLLEHKWLSTSPRKHGILTWVLCKKQIHGTCRQINSSAKLR